MWTGQRGDTGPDVRGDAADVVATQFDLTRVEAGAYSSPSSGTEPAIASPHDTARAGPSKRASTPSPVDFTKTPR